MVFVVKKSRYFNDVLQFRTFFSHVSVFLQKFVLSIFKKVRVIKFTIFVHFFHLVPEIVYIDSKTLGSKEELQSQAIFCYLISKGSSYETDIVNKKMIRFQKTYKKFEQR